MKIKKGDKVIIIAGKHKGEKGQVKQSIIKNNKVIIEGINKRTHRVRGQKDKTTVKEAPIDVSNVQILENDKPVRVGYTFKDKKKVRVSKKTGKEI